MNIQEVKRLARIKTDKYDEYLTEIVPLLVEFARDKCNQLFEDDSGNEKLPAGIKLFVAKAAEFYANPQGLSSRSMDTVSYSFEVELPQTTLDMLRPYRKLRW